MLTRSTKTARPTRNATRRKKKEAAPVVQTEAASAPAQTTTAKWKERIDFATSILRFVWAVVQPVLHLPHADVPHPSAALTTPARLP